MNCKVSIYCIWSVCFSSLSLASTKVEIIDQDGSPVVNAVVSVADDSITANLSEVAIMDQVDKQFLPKVLVINKGQQVSFPNSDDIRHHVYSFSTIKPFEIRLYKGSTEEPILYDKAGIGVLGCNIHDNMVGYIYVADNEQARVTNQLGQVELDISDIQQVTVWHPDLGVGSTEKLKVKLQMTDGIQRGQVTLNKVAAKEQQNTFRSRKFGQ